MKAQIGIKIAVVALILALTVMPVAASGSLIWRTATVDSSGDRGTHTSIAFHPTSGTPWISYYDEGNKDLMVAHRVSSGGNCGPNDEWKCETVDSTGDVGRYSSIDVAPLDIWKVGVAYYDVTNSALKFAEYKCVLGSCSWSAVTIDGEGYEYYPSIKYDASGRPHIAYSVILGGGDFPLQELRFAYRKDSGGNCGPGNSWYCYTVDSGYGSGTNYPYQYVSMEMTYAGSTLIPYIAYYDGTNGDLMLARYVGGSGGSGCTHASWSCQTIDGASADVGQSVSFELTNAQYFAYYDATNGKLKYAYRVWAGEGNCGGGDFQCITIGDAASPAGARSISLAVDGADNPLIAYRYGSGNVSQLRVAQPINAAGVANGNCGPQLGFLFTWQCLTVDTAGPLFSIAKHVSADFDPSGLPMIAYSEYYYNPIGGGSDYDLMIAYGRLGVFLPLVLRNYP